jgi:hypothetical protein
MMPSLAPRRPHDDGPRMTDGTGGRLRSFLVAAHEDAAEYCEDRSSLGCVARTALTLCLVYTGVRYVRDPFFVSLFDGITLVFHEMGHLLARPFGHTIYFLGGSLNQLVVPTIAAIYLLVRQRDWFGFAVGTSWLGFSGFNLATYIGDANKENLPLASMSEQMPKHDWATLLTDWHMLNSCEAIAAVVRVLAFSIWAASIALASWLVARMIRLRSASLPPRGR